MKILIVEDEYNLAEIIADRLTKEKYFVDIITDGEEGLYNASSGIYDLIILDVMLPNMDGFEILKRIRKDNIKSKVIMLTAKSMLEDKLNGFSFGANDYVSKPFHIDELIARVNIQLKDPSLIKNKDTLTYKDLELNLNNSKITCTKSNETVELVKKEFQLLEFFMRNPEQILSKDQIYDRVWGMESETLSNNLEAYLSFIRRKIKAVDSAVVIKPVRGLGYKMEERNEQAKK